MKTDTSFERPEPRTVALLTGLSIGMGLAVHEIFFLVAAVIALIVPLKCLARYLHELEQRPRHYRPA